ncbi:MAG TPA: class I SAM-dependent methyltransferase [candidate division Zixibacteria bacterium]|nr:class I SAM-dependent methyltransferase [candidate division Zixibacteria bacterium]
MRTSDEPKRFDRFADDYKALLDRSVSITGEGGEHFARVKAAYMASVLGAKFSGRLLDFGCGVGLLSQALCDQFPGAQRDGFDPSPASIASISDRLKQAGNFTSIREHLRPGYEAIVLANVLHHVPVTEHQNTINFCVQLLAQRGRLFIFEHNPLNPVTRHAVDRCPFDEHAVLLRAGESIALLRNAGLTAISRDYIVFFPKFLAAARPLERFLAWFPLGAQHVSTGMKN